MDGSTTCTEEMAPRITSRRSSYKGTMTVVATFALATAFALAGAPIAAASTNDDMPFESATVNFDNPARLDDCDQPDCWPGMGDDPWPGPGWPGPRADPGWQRPGHGHWNRQTVSAPTEAAQSDLVSPTQKNPQCNNWPGACLESTKLQELA